MSPIRYVDEKAKLQPSPGSTGYARRAADAGRTQVAIAEDAAVGLEIATRDEEVEALNARLADLDRVLAASRKLNEDQDAYIAALKATLAERDAELAELTRKFVDAQRIIARVGETEIDKPTNKPTEQVALSDKPTEDDKPTKRKRYPKGQEPWTLKGISDTAWRKREAKKAKGET